MFCIHCGSKVIKNGKFCAACGSQISKSENPEIDNQDVLTRSIAARSEYIDLRQYNPKTPVFYFLNVAFWVMALLALATFSMQTIPHVTKEFSSLSNQYGYILGQGIGLALIVLPFLLVRNWYKRWHQRTSQAR